MFGKNQVRLTGGTWLKVPSVQKHLNAILDMPEKPEMNLPAPIGMEKTQATQRLGYTKVVLPFYICKSALKHGAASTCFL